MAGAYRSQVLYLLPNADRTTRARLYVSASAPTMMVSVPASAPLTPPLTGASAKEPPRAARRPAIWREIAGSPRRAIDQKRTGSESLFEAPRGPPERVLLRGR